MKILSLPGLLYVPVRSFQAVFSRYGFLVLLFWPGFINSATAQLPFFLRVARQPLDLRAGKTNAGLSKITVPVAKAEAAFSLQAPDSAPWIVYSDRANNNTYRNANGMVPYRKMGFMDAFFVLKAQNGYLKLIKYDPALPIGSKFSRRAITDRKAVVYYGWAPRGRFLLSNQSVRSADQRRPQIYSAVLSQPSLLTNPERYFSNDSVKLFTEPTQQTPTTLRMRLYDLTYVYKFSETRRQALIGRASWFPTDSVKQIMSGWVPIEVLQDVGQRLFMEADTMNQAIKPVPLYRSLAAAVYKRNDSTVISMPFQAVSWNQFGNKFPILNQFKSSKDSQTIVQTNGLIPALTRKAVAVYNVNGQPISSQLLANIKAHRHQYNLIYVIEGSSAMQPYWGELLNTIQFTVAQLTPDTIFANRLRVGLVLYNEYKKVEDNKVRGNVDVRPLTTNYTYVLNELKKLVPPAKVKSEPDSKSVRFGVGKALELFAAHPNENNILVLVGIHGDMQSIVDGILVPSGLKSVECRLLAFQAYAPPGEVANNFVLHARELVLQVADMGGALKKNRLVRPDMVTTTNEFDHRIGDRNDYQLAYPERSMVPGWVLFPRKNQSLPFKELYEATDSLFRQVNHESQTVVSALETMFQQSEQRGDQVNPKLTPVFAAAGLPVPASASALMRFNPYPYLTRAYTPTAIQGGARWKFIALLTLDEYESVGRWLERLCGEDIDPALYFDRLRLHHHYRKIMQEIGLSNQNTPTVDQLLNGILELPVTNPLLKGIRISQIMNRKQLPDAVLNQVLYLLRERRDYFRRIPTFRNSQFTSNGRTYYWVSEDLFK